MISAVGARSDVIYGTVWVGVLNHIGNEIATGEDVRALGFGVNDVSIDANLLKIVGEFVLQIPFRLQRCIT